MTLDEIKQLIEFIKAHDLSEFELEQDGVKVRIKSGGEPSRGGGAARHGGARRRCWRRRRRRVGRRRRRRAAGAEEGARAGDREVADRRHVLPRRPSRAPRRSSSVGDTVRKGQVLCIIEAMKLMNEIDSEYDGEVASVYVENGQAVQYGERLFAIKPAN